MSTIEKKSTKFSDKIGSEKSATATTASKNKSDNKKEQQSTLLNKVQEMAKLDSLKTELPTENSLYNQIYELAANCASTELGQYTIEKMDAFLTIVEKTARWSLPESTDSSKNKEAKSQKLERPCGWLPFLTLIIALRCIRIAVSFAALIIGNDPVTPESVVHFLQTRRRKLRAIKYQGLKALRLKQKMAEHSVKNAGVIAKLTSIMNFVVCRPGQMVECASIPISKSSQTCKHTLNTDMHSEPAKKRPLEEDGDCDESIDDSDNELHVTELLDKYGDKSDLDDSDYVPDPKDEESSSSDTEDEQIDIEEKSDDEVKVELGISSKKNQENGSTETNQSTVTPSTSVNGTEEKKNGTIEETLNGDQENSSENDNKNPKSTDINPVKLSPKIGLRIRCQDLTKLAGGDECFYSPIGSPPRNIADEKLIHMPSFLTSNMSILENNMRGGEMQSTVNGTDESEATSGADTSNTEQNNAKTQTNDTKTHSNKNNQSKHKQYKKNYHRNHRHNKGKRH